jgi:hypothetical protein
MGFMATAVTVDPLLRNCHGDPTFQALLAKMKLDAWKHQGDVDHGMIGLARGRVKTPDALIEMMLHCAFDGY